MVWTPESVKELLEESVDTIRRLRKTGCFPAEIQSAMPDVVQNFWDVNGKREQGPTGPDHEDRAPLLPPTKAAIDRLDTAIPLFYTVPHKGRRRDIVWFMAMGLPATRIAKETGRHRNTIARIYANECERMAKMVNTTKKNSANGAQWCYETC